MMVLRENNPHHSWLGLTEQQNLTFGEASLVRSEGVLYFCNGCKCSTIRCNGRQSLRLDGRKVCSIKRVDVSQAESNKIKACALPSIHLPLTREASVVVRGEGLLSFCNGCEGGSIRCNGRSKQGKGVSDFRGIVRFLEGLVKRYHL